MNTYYNGTKILIGAAGIIVAVIIGVTLSLGGEGTIMLMILFYVLGISVGPRVLFGFVNPGFKIYLAAGPVGVAFVKLSIKIFTADGKVSENEQNKLKRYIGKEFGEDIGRATELFIKSKPEIEESIFQICKPLVKMKSTYRVTIMFQLFAMAASDGEYSQVEEDVLLKIGKYLRIGKNRFYFIKSKVINKEESGEAYEYYQRDQQQRSSSSGNRFFQQFFAQANDPFFILGIEYNASNDEIKKAYRELVKKYHPDLAMDKSEQYRKEIMERVQEVNEAYEKLKKLRGIK